MNLKIIINLSFIIILAFPVVRLFFKYFGFYIAFMFNSGFKWDKAIEKPRLFFYSVIIPLLLVLRTALIAELDREKDINTLLLILYIIVFVAFSSLLYFSWTNIFKYKFIPKAEKIFDNINSPHKEKVTSNDENINKVHKRLLNKYIDCSIDSFRCLLEQSDLNQSSKIKWLDVGEKNHTELNKQTLLEFIFLLFPDVYDSKRNQYRRKMIIAISDHYFCSKDGSKIEISNSVIDKWKKNNGNTRKKIKPLIAELL